MRLQSIFLSSAALVASATVGFAADLPTKKAAPVEYVRVCSQFGAGYFYIPGSDTCIKVGGRIRSEYFYNEPLKRSDNTTLFRTRGYLSLDTMTATDMGPVRTAMRVYTQALSGSTGGVSAQIDYAYAQFAGFTAGRFAASFFEFAPFGGVSLQGGGDNGRGADAYSVNTLAYTFNAGNGLLATLALEDAGTRRVGINTNGSGYAGILAPDVVGRIDWTQPWGQVALSGALHQIRYTSADYDTTYGFAIQGGLKVNLPMLAAGDALFLQAAYADGASSYTGFGGATIANYTPVAVDATTVAPGSVKTVKTWSVSGGIEHYWVPTVSTALFASYADYNAYGSTSDFCTMGMGANVKWTPVKGLLIASEAVYQKAVDVPAGYFGTASARQTDIWSGRLRIQRDF